MRSQPRSDITMNGVYSESVVNRGGRSESAGTASRRQQLLNTVLLSRAERAPA